jgi:transcriptional regulator with XRE-family HTH domain
MTTDQETAVDYLRRVINESGKSISKVSREADTSPAVLDSVLSGRRNLGVDLAIRIAHALDVDLITFLVGVRILPAKTTKSDEALKYALLTVFDELDEVQQKQLVNIAKAIKADP